MTILITGATGLIGKALVAFFAAQPDAHILAAVRNPDKGHRLFDRYGDRVELVTWDVTTPAAFSHGSVDYLVHAAAETASRAFVEHPVDVIRTIIDGTTNVLAFARAASVKSMVFLSTMEVYGLPVCDPVTENDYGPLDPTSVRASYPEAKRLAESLCAATAHEYGVPVKIARLTQTFGEGVARNDTRVFAQFANAVFEKRDIVLHTDGATARCYCSISDAISAIWTILQKGVNGEAYTVANADTFCTIRQMADMLSADHPASRVVVDQSAAVGKGYAPEFRMRLSTRKLEALGWRPHVGLREMFDRLLADWASSSFSPAHTDSESRSSFPR